MLKRAFSLPEKINRDYKDTGGCTAQTTENENFFSETKILR